MALDRVVPGAPGETLQARKLRDQLFRIYRSEKDTENLSVKVWARHIYYDPAGRGFGVTSRTKTIAQALNEINAAGIPDNHGFRFLTDNTDKTLSAKYNTKCMVEAHLDPEQGILSVGNLRLIRDNYDVFFVDRSVTKRTPITYARNLIGVEIGYQRGVTNRIIPVGTDADSNPIYIDSTYVDSPRNHEATMIQARVIEYKDAKVEKDKMTLAQAKAKLLEMAQADFAAGIDLPDISVTVNFLQGDTQEYQQFRELDRLYLGDLVEVIDDLHGVEFEAEVNEYDYDCLDPAIH